MLRSLTLYACAQDPKSPGPDSTQTLNPEPYNLTRRIEEKKCLHISIAYVEAQGTSDFGIWAFLSSEVPLAWPVYPLLCGSSP